MDCVIIAPCLGNGIELSEVEMESSADHGALDVLGLYSVNHRGRAKKPVDEYAAFDSGSGKPNAANLSKVGLQL